MKKGNFKVSFFCLECGKQDFYKKSQDRFYKGNGKYCSMKCRWSFYRAHPEATPTFVYGKSKTTHGYIVVGSDDRRQYEHRLVMEKHLGRKLSRDENVHHLNGIKTDNRIENLEVMSASEHHKRHCAEGVGITSEKSRINSQIALKRRWDEWREKGKWSFRFDGCTECGTKEIKHQGRGKCRRCYLRDYAKAANA